MPPSRTPSQPASVLDALRTTTPSCAWTHPQRRQRTLEALARVLLRESQVQPLLLVFEDLRWIDTGTQALLDRLVAACQQPAFCYWSTTGQSINMAGE